MQRDAEERKAYMKEYYKKWKDNPEWKARINELQKIKKRETYIHTNIKCSGENCNSMIRPKNSKCKDLENNPLCWQCIRKAQFAENKKNRILKRDENGKYHYPLPERKTLSCSICGKGRIKKNNMTDEELKNILCKVCQVKNTT